MKQLKDYENELKTCSKCGLCQSVCPVYKATGIETVVSRGKFNLLLGLIKKDLTYTKNFDKNLSLCLHCKACDDFCPSSIKAEEIISSAKIDNKKFNIFSSNLTIFKIKLLFASFLFKFYRVMHITNFVSKNELFFKKFGVLGKTFVLFNRIAKINVQRKKTKAKKPELRVIYFEGCFTKYFNPSNKNALLNLLEKNNIEVITKKFNCCGLSALYSGNLKLYEKLKEKNIKLLNEPCDYIVCDCATCLGALKEYNQSFSDKIIDISELLEKITDLKNTPSVTYHLPCHLREKKDKILQVVKKFTKNYVPLNENDVCCGFAGEFAINYPEISGKIAKNKADNIKNTKTEYVLTSCPGCVIGLNKGLIETNCETKVLNLTEFVEINS